VPVLVPTAVGATGLPTCTHAGALGQLVACAVEVAKKWQGGGRGGG
jgi:hypothetical protein